MRQKADTTALESKVGQIETLLTTIAADMASLERELEAGRTLSGEEEEEVRRLFEKEIRHVRHVRREIEEINIGRQVRRRLPGMRNRILIEEYERERVADRMEKEAREAYKEARRLRDKYKW